MGATVNEVDDPAAVLALPMEEDVDVIREVLDDAFDEIEDDYIRGIESDRGTTAPTELSGSLFQELLAQLNKQEDE